MKEPKCFAGWDKYLKVMRQMGREPTALYMDQATAKTMKIFTKALRRQNMAHFGGYDARYCTYQGVKVTNA